MSLIKRRMTEAALAANRSNARRSTGPRTRAGKAQSRLNALQHGGRSQLAARYFRLWWNAWMTGPWEGPRLDVSKMPVPFLASEIFGKRRAPLMREFLAEAAPYLPVGRRVAADQRPRPGVAASKPVASRGGGACSNNFF